MPEHRTETAVFGAGCFWCTEAVFQRLRGVYSVMPGYAGGTKEKPTYEEVSAGTTNHAEVAEIVFDPAVITYRDLLEVFFATHDPTTLNRQGNDTGTQYRSVILYLGDEQEQQAEAIVQELAREKIFAKPIVTEIAKRNVFYPAEEHHRDYYNSNISEPYCQFVIAPKLAKFKKKFTSLLRTDLE